MKNNNNGTKIIILNAEVATGNCLPVSSCLFLAHLLRKKLETKDKIKAIKTYEKPFSKTGLGEYMPLLEIKNVSKNSRDCLTLGS
tara:strand:- start:48 stop:302 length:255 start_codon:yes stop_codon:yes gene_type:complete